MKKLFLVLLLSLLSVTAFASGPMSVQTDQNNGFITLATYTFDIASTTVLDINDVFDYANIGATQIKGFKFKVFGGDCVLGPSNVATGTYYNGEYVASGTVFPGWTGLKNSTVSTYNMKIAPLATSIKVVFWAW